MRATVTIDKWLLAASAKLGAIEMLDNLNTGKRFALVILAIGVSMDDDSGKLVKKTEWAKLVLEPVNFRLPSSPSLLNQESS